MKLVEFIKKALSESDGLPSSARLNLFIAVIILLPCIAFTLVFVTLFYQGLIIGCLTLVISFVTGLYGLKVWQRNQE